MRLYGRKFARRALEKKTRAVQETRDGILWSIEDSTKTCRVKIQGTDTLIVAHYPRNWKSIPYWLKRGNAVRVLHRGGNRGYVEVIGEGRAIPTPIAGDAMPDNDTLPDGIVTGCTMTGMGDAMGAVITSGTYRINGTIYSLSVNGQDRYYDSEPDAYYDSGLPEFFLPDSGDIPKGVADAPAVGMFRYDAFCVGVDGVIDYVQGTASATPSQPVLPADHVLINNSYILVVGGATVIENKDIGRQWSAPYAATLEIDIEGSGFSYDMPFVPGSPPPQYVDADIALRIRDQFNNIYSAASCSATITKEIGGGTFSSTSFSFTGSTTITWTRDQNDNGDNLTMVFTVSGTVSGRAHTIAGIINPQEGT